jgi:formylglycine-generating enzyme required for sulfatase activity
MRVSWNDTQEYITWLNEKTGKKYRLPTEAEWEYAARAGSKTAYWWGKTASHDYANYGKDECCAGLASGKDKWVYTSPVGSFPENPFKLFDMHGNVWEWVQDYYGTYPDKALQDPVGASSGPLRVFRGGSWSYTPRDVRSAVRDWNTPDYRNSDVGFRLAQDQSQ